MLTDRQWLEAELARYTYRPGWIWRIVSMTESLFSHYEIEIIFWALDATGPPGPKRLIQLKSRQWVPLWITDTRNPELLKSWFQTTIFSVEQHESREWLRRDGKLVEDPHKMDKHPALIPMPLTIPVPRGTLPDVRQEQPTTEQDS